MKRLYAAVAALIGGCVLWWLSVYLSGFLAAQTWPAFVLALRKSGSSEAVYIWEATLGFVPMFLATVLVGSVLFRVVGGRAEALIAAVLPYVLMNWIMGSFEAIFGGSPLYRHTTWLVLLALSAFPLGLFVAWWLSRRRHLTPPSSGQPPAGFAV